MNTELLVELARRPSLTIRRSALAALAALTLLASGSSTAQEETYTIDPAHTLPTFEVSALGVHTVVGYFDDTRGRVRIDPDAKMASIEVTIATRSVRTELLPIERELRSPDFFDSERFPTMTFRSAHLDFRKQRLVRAEGELTLRGRTRPVTLQVERFACRRDASDGRKACDGVLTASIDRTEFGMGRFPPPLISRQVRIRIAVAALLDVGSGSTAARTAGSQTRTG